MCPQLTHVSSPDSAHQQTHFSLKLQITPSLFSSVFVVPCFYIILAVLQQSHDQAWQLKWTQHDIALWSVENVGHLETSSSFDHFCGCVRCAGVKSMRWWCCNISERHNNIGLSWKFRHRQRQIVTSYHSLSLLLTFLNFLESNIKINFVLKRWVFSLRNNFLLKCPQLRTR